MIQTVFNRENWKGGELVSKIYNITAISWILMIYTMFFIAMNNNNQYINKQITEEEFNTVNQQLSTFFIWSIILLGLIILVSQLLFFRYKFNIVTENSGKLRLKGWGFVADGIIEPFKWKINCIIPWSKVPEEIKKMVDLREDELDKATQMGDEIANAEA